MRGFINVLGSTGLKVREGEGILERIARVGNVNLVVETQVELLEAGPPLKGGILEKIHKK